MALTAHADFVAVPAKAVTSVANDTLSGVRDIDVGEVLIGCCYVLAGTPSITDSLGNTYTRVGTTSIFTGTATVGGTGVTVTWHSTSSTAIAGSLIGYTGAKASGVTVTSASGTSLAPSSGASASIPSGDAVVGFSNSNGPSTDFSANDTDTTNGSWTSHGVKGTTGGGATSNVLNIAADKIVTGTGAQTYDTALLNSRAWNAYIVYVPAAAKSLLPGERRVRRNHLLRR